MHTKNKRFTYINKKENICDYFIDNEEGLDYTGHNLKEITDLSFHVVEYPDFFLS